METIYWLLDWQACRTVEDIGGEQEWAQKAILYNGTSSAGWLQTRGWRYPEWDPLALTVADDSPALQWSLEVLFWGSSEPKHDLQRPVNPTPLVEGFMKWWKHSPKQLACGWKEVVWWTQRVVTTAFQSSEVKCEPQAKKRNCPFLGWIKVFIFYSKEKSGEEWNQNFCVPMKCHREMLGVLWYCWPLRYWYSMQVSAGSCIFLFSPH